jgi:hypothetical protein
MAVVVTAADAALCIWFSEAGKMIGKVYSCFGELCGKANDFFFNFLALILAVARASGDTVAALPFRT